MALTEVEKINRRAYDKLALEMQSFIRTRYLNTDVNPESAKALIGIVVDNIKKERLAHFFKYLI